MRIRVGILSLVVLLTLVLVQCDSAGQAANETVRIGTWNLEWFGALGRTETDIKAVANIIKDQQIDILALQEITCECTLKSLATELGYSYFLSPQRVPQKLALLWNPEIVKTVEFDKASYTALRRVAETGLDRELRQPLVFKIVAGKFDFSLVVVHLKSIPEAERSLEIRNIQYKTLNDWLRADLSKPDADQDIIIAGDFNSYRSGVSSETLISGGDVDFLTKKLSDDEYSNIWYDRDGNRNKSLIDQIAVTKALRKGEFQEILPIEDLDKKFGEKEYELHISDHLPVVAVFQTSRDLD